MVASFQLASATQLISREEMALELASTLRHRPTGKDALEHLLEAALVRNAATDAKLLPTADEIRAKIQEIKAQQPDFEKTLRSHRILRQTFIDNLALGMAKEKLVMAEMGKTDPSKVKADELQEMMQLWSKEARQKAKIETDPSKLDAGLAATVDGSEISMMDLGQAIFTKLETEDLRSRIHELIHRLLILQKAKEAGLSLSPEEIEAEVQERKRQVEAKPDNQGVTFEQQLSAMGLTVDDIRKSQNLRAQILLRKLVQRQYPKESINHMLAKEGDSIRARHGARRKLDIIFLRASETPNVMVPRDFSKAEAEARALREKLASGRTFADLAQKYSDDPSKTKAGNIDWQPRQYPEGSRKQRVPPEVLEAAFSCEVMQTTGPVKTKVGYYLARVTGIEPEPSVAELQHRLSMELSNKFGRQMVEEAKIQILLP